ncbi:hypothetical protein B7R54_03275 [Subtercola boreus]|uniref:Uncharacterized protein n=1 Tax=Subtercola boreus TaxID=120213 RepID=A0A3E0VHL5_9MICO|nr:hypothetical protein [Subtercola boreus]RFA08357.1 hypothetical protein B7R54_03275 [Subtercola boreus]TQL54741.1 hypothetical protein FB464_2285 [Subtercola boreus]
MNTRPARVLRGLAAAFFAVFVAALSHVAGGGGTPGAVGVALALAFSSVVCVALAGRSLSIIRLSASVIVSQALLHALFTVGATGSGSTFEMSGSGHHGVALVVSASFGAGSLGAGTGAAGWLADQLCSGMWIAHAVAAVITVLALRHGEGALWALVGLAGMRFRRLVRQLFIEPLPALKGVGPALSAPLDHLRDLGVFLGRLRHRGPPVCVRFAN